MASMRPLTISLVTFRERQREPGPADARFGAFLYQVGRRAMTLAKELGLRLFPPIDTGELTPDQAVTLIRQRVAPLTGRTTTIAGSTLILARHARDPTHVWGATV